MNSVGELKRSLKGFVNGILRPLSVQLVSVKAPANYLVAQKEIYRLRRNEHLLGVALSRWEVASEFERRWMQFLLQSIGINEAKSENGQDLFALFCLFDVQDGYFVEFGAFDGEMFSNSYLFENLGWRGLLIEPVRDAFLSCTKKRKAEVVHGAVDPEFSDAPGVIEIIEAGLQSATTVQASSDRSQASVLEHIDEAKRSQAKTSGRSEFTRLLNLQERRRDRASRVDFMSIDVEGDEAAIVERFDFKKFGVKVVCVEHNWRLGDLARMDGAMRKAGFVKVLPEYSSRDAWFLEAERFAFLSSDQYVAKELSVLGHGN